MNNYDGLLYQEPTGDGHVHYKFTGLLPYACHKFLCAYAGLSLRATERPWIVPCYDKHDPSYSHWKQKENRTNSISLESKKKKKQRNRNELSHAGQKQIDDVQQLHSVQLTATAANVSFNFAKKGL